MSDAPRLTRDPGDPTRLVPVVMLLGDGVVARCRWTLERETERLETIMQGLPPDVRSTFAANGWTAELLAWGHIVAGLMDLAEFDDERGRTG